MPAHLSSVPAVPAGHDEMRRQLLLVLVGDVLDQISGGANLGVLVNLNAGGRAQKLHLKSD